MEAPYVESNGIDMLSQKEGLYWILQASQY